ncbi:MAG: hypothetical protein WC145_05460 [Aliarcobacter sp.]
MKKTKLTSNKGFKVSVSEKEQSGIVCSARSQCRTTHKRKDC